MEDGELTFDEGEFIAVTSQDDGGWWEGYIPGKVDDVAMFPSNYVKPV